MKKQLLNRKRLLPFFYSLFMIFMSINMSWGQAQTIGSFPYMEGGFENYAASTLTSTLSPTLWSVSSSGNSTTKAILNNAAVARTGSKCASHTTQVATNIRLQSPTTATAANAPAPNTSHTIQYYYNTTTDQTASLQGAIYNTATDSKQGLVTSTYLSGVWVKATYTAVINAAAVVASTNFAAVRHLAITSSNVLIDDFVVYAGAVDTSDPVGPTLPLVNGLNISWTASASVDGGGYMVVRYASLPNADNDPNVNGIYGVGNTITNGTAALSGTVVYVGTGTSFTDAVPGSVSGSDYYKIYTVDKAFNYSKTDEITGTSLPAGSPLITSTPTVPLTGFTFVQGSGPSLAKQTVISGSNLSSNIIVSLPTNYELSKDNFATPAATGTVDLGLEGGTLSIRLKASLPNGVYNENIVLTSGATVLNVPLTGSLSGSYLYSGSGSLTDAANWTPTPNVTGANGTFNIRSTVTTNAAWVLGAGSKIVLGDPSAAAVTLTIANTFPVTGTIDIAAAASSGSNSLVLQDLNIQPTFGILDNTSEVHFQAAITYTISATFGNLLVDGSGSTTFSGNFIVNTSLTVPSGSRLTISGGTSNYIVINTGASVTINGTFKTGKAAGAFSYNVGTPGSTLGSIQFKDAAPIFTLGAASNVEYTRNTTSSTQSISTLPTGIDYANLTISDGNPYTDCNKSFAGAIKVKNTFTLNQGASTLSDCGFLTLADGATIVKTVGSFDVPPTFGASVNVTYNGVSAVVAGNEMPASSTVLKDLTINNAAGLTLSADTTLKGTLTLTSGTITTGSYSLIIANTGTAISRTSGHVVGNLKKLTAASASPSFKYEIGDATNYTPVDLTFAGNTSATGSITASTAGVVPAVAGSGINGAKDVNRTWTLTNDGIAGFTNYGAAFTYASTDNDTGTTPDNYEIHLNSGSWSNLTKDGLSTNISAAATGITSFGSFRIGESDGTLGLASYAGSQSQCTVYPNPVSNGKLYISSPSSSEKQVSIFSVLGQKVLDAKTTNNAEINVSKLAKGNYILKITEDGKSEAKKFIIQ